MKKLIKFIIIMLIITSCDETESVIYDESGEYGIGFSSPSLVSIIVPEEGITTTLTVQTSSQSSSERTFDVTVDSDLSVGDSSNYTIGTLTIPANSYEGQIDITFSNFSNLVENTLYKLVVNLNLPDNVGEFDSQIVTLNYLKKVICNDVDLTISTDYWSDETTWELKDADGTVLQSGGPYPRVNGGSIYNLQFHLEDGAHTFIMYDSFGDGMVTGAQTGIDAVIGSYSLDCGLINHVTGGGAFGAIEETEFYINL